MSASQHYRKRRAGDFAEYTPGEPATPSVSTTSSATRDFNNNIARSKNAARQAAQPGSSTQKVHHTIMSVGARGSRARTRNLHTNAAASASSTPAPVLGDKARTKATGTGMASQLKPVCYNLTRTP